MISAVNSSETDASERNPKVMPIAIIGMACRFPGGASSPESLWDLCANGQTAWSPTPKSRFHAESWYHPDKEHLGTSYVKGAHFLAEDISRFDAAFFNLIADAASTMDPEVRLQLETAYEALESAGLPLDQVAGSRTGVYAGTCFRDDHDSLLRDPDTLARSFLTGNGAAMIANRISHFFDLRGPSLMVDTGCSTTLTLLHLACQSLRAGESDMAIVGGSNILLNPDMFIAGSNLSLLSAEGRCFAFDARATGYGRGDGIASIVIKPLITAVRDGDPIRAVIRNSAANQDGKTATLTSPRQEAQEVLMQECYEMAGLDPRDTDFVEAHGTGTQAGDTIEARSIGRVFGLRRSTECPLLIGSVKTNIGHTEAASGLAGVIKAVMAMEKQAIPPHLNFESPNENIAFDALNLKIPLSLQEWPSLSLRRASINNFGYGGANAHVIIESPEILQRSTPFSGRVNTSNPKKRSRVFVLSAKDSGVARRMGENLCDYLAARIRESEGSEESEEELLDQLAFTLGQRRTRFPCTIAWSGSSITEVHATIDAPGLTTQRSMRVPRVGMVFTGQGAQWFAMGRELLDAYPVFCDAIHEVDACLKSMGATWSALEELQRNAEESRLNQVAYSLPLSVAIQLALVDLLRSWGVYPAGVTAHSSGEVGAAYAAGAITLKGALAIVYIRGVLTSQYQQLLDRRGGMVAVGLGRQDAEKALAEVRSGKAIVACVNSPSSVTISGDECAIEEIKTLLHGRGVFVRRLHVEAAYHSHHMLPLAEAYRAQLSRFLELNPVVDTGIIYSSPTTGGRITSAAEIAHPDHWVRNMVQPVEFLSSLRNLCHDDSDATRTAIDMLVEVGPHGALSGPIRQTLTLPEMSSGGITYATCLSRGQNAVQTMHQLVCTLLQAGYPVDLEAVNFPCGWSTLPVLTNLPPYPWNHETSYWAEPRRNEELRHRTVIPHDLLGVPAPGSTLTTPTWRHIVRPRGIPWVRDHIVQGEIVYPGAGFMSMVVEALRQLQSPAQPIHGYELQEIRIHKPLILEDSAEGVEVQLSLRACSDQVRQGQGWYEFLIESVKQMNGSSTLHCEGLCCTSVLAQSAGWIGPPAPTAAPLPVPPSTWRTLDPADMYRMLDAVGLCLGPVFRNLVSAKSAPGYAQSVIQVADSATTMPQQYQQPHIIHPTTLDAVFHAAYQTLPVGGSEERAAMIPTSIQDLYISADLTASPGHRFHANSTLVRVSRRGFETSIRVTNTGAESEKSVLTVQGLWCQSLGPHPAMRMPDDRLCYTSVWKPDIDFVRPEHLTEPDAPSGTHPHLSQLQTAAVMFIVDALHQFQGKDLVASEHSSYWKWMTDVAERARPILDILGVTAHGMAALTQELRQCVEGRLLCRFGEKLPDVLSGIAQAKDILLEFMAENQAEILEVGTGNGANTRRFIKTLTKDDTRLFSRYEVTASSAGLVKNADTVLKDEADIECKALDLNAEPDAQGYARRSYDLLILSASALLTVKEMVQTPSSLHALLAPGGRCILWGPSLGDGWQASFHASGLWKELCVQAGFESVSSHLQPDLNADGYQGEVVVATAKTDVTSATQTEVLLISRTNPPEDWQQALQHGLAAEFVSGVSVVSSLEEVVADGKTCIVLDELFQPMLDDPTAEQFHALQRVLSSCRATVWVSCGAQCNAEEPLNSLHQGLLRTLRCENPLRRYVSVDLDPNAPVWSLSTATDIAHIVRNTLAASSAPQSETEYAVRDSAIHISRVYEDQQEAQLVGTTRPQAPEMRPWSTPGQNIRLEVATPGLLNSLVFTEDPTIDEALADDCVEIEPCAFGLNFRDIMVALGQLDETRMGFECSGVITHAGPRVYAFILGYFATRVRIPFTNVAQMPAEMDFLTAASIPLAFITAYHALVDLARLQRDERVLIHSGTGGVGQAAIMVARWIGAEIFVTVGSEHKRDFLVEEYGIRPSHIFSSRNRSFANHLMSATKGKGVDVVLNSLAGALLRETWQCVGMVGRFIEIGKRDIEQNSMVEMGPFGRSTMFASLDLITLGERRGKEVQRILGAINGLMEKREIRPVRPITRFDMGDIEKAFRTMQTGQHVGKIVMEVKKEEEEEEKVKVKLQRAVRPVVMLSREETYLIVGGVGGIGQYFAQRLVVEGGVRHLLLLSRSAASASTSTSTTTTTTKTPPWLAHLRHTTGASIVLVSCDVTNATQLQPVLQQHACHLPPIRGVIQAAMVLKDGIFETMTRDDYLAAIKPKVQGSWNLHTLLPPDLRFFILLSSISGFGGNAGQANYAAGGSYQDALARYRASQGLPAVSIDLGMVSSVGVVAESKPLTHHLENLGLRAVSEQEVWALVASAIRHPIRTPETCHIVTGLPRGLVRSEATAGWNRDARFAILEQQTPSSSGPASRSSPEAGLRDHLAATTTLTEAILVIENALVTKLAEMFSRIPEGIDPSLPLAQFGVDSLVAVELRNWSVATVQADCSIFDVMQAVSVTGLAGKMAEKSQFFKL
ncbi:type I polyketide synthase [Aspergillus aculeatinus CBS 121060]|uniref:Ketoacyl-synt-domain-containing protein n=1 Tax=Aspergillus aculeatinus CBS 121060 TaxID=1448322 RepID=A0ACD1H8S3_9EURO|nr:ketoacyl-synt-domain-containing protein [Aspergillus aculeatinus CBS 121060]RAH70054.1 ketoacyl-synt-domain-containing protein [Aspergillus aculeatinus CBS 121060]